MGKEFEDQRCDLGDLYAKRNQLTLAEAWGGKADKIEVCISIEIQENKADLVELVQRYVEKGCKRILCELRNHFLDVPLMAGAKRIHFRISICSSSWHIRNCSLHTECRGF